MRKKPGPRRKKRREEKRANYALYNVQDWRRRRRMENKT